MHHSCLSKASAHCATIPPIQDRYAEAEAIPPIDASQDWVLLEAAESDGYTSLTFIRKFYTCDEFDRDIAVRTFWL